jgi:polysaccharide biosynthesis protein PslG
LTRVTRSPLPLALALAAVLLLALPAASHAGRKAPRHFFGVVYAPPGSPPPFPSSFRDFELMDRAGVQAIRADFAWFAMEPNQGDIRFQMTDATVALAAANGMDVLPIVNSTPRWASPQQSGNYSIWPPRDYELYANFLRALIARYGPAGSFWAERPDLPRRPIRNWQIWNEPAADYFWAAPGYKRDYPRLLRTAYRAIKQADPGAKVVLSGLASFIERSGRTTTSWGDLAAFYRNGLRGNYDVLALHPFSKTLAGTIKTIRKNRAVLRRFREPRKPIWLTELSWPAPGSAVPKRRRLGIEVSQRQQRKLMTAAFRRFRRDRRLGVQRAYWYNWSSTYSARDCLGRAPTFQFVGLVKTPCGGSTVQPTALFRTFSRVAP